MFLMFLIFYLFWGPLYPLNPLKFGCKKLVSSRATIFVKDFDGDSILYQIDEILEEEERFHGLRFKEKFKVIVLEKDSNMKRYLPWMKGTGYSVKLGAFNVIYIGANARNSPFGIGVYLKHEISHLLLHQNTPSMDNNLEIQRQGWLSEGIATYFGGPHFYEKYEFAAIWKEKGLTFDKLYEENPLKMGSSFNLKYTYNRFFIEFLIETYGLEKFQSYLKSYINNPKIYKHIFSTIFGENLEEILHKFNTHMSN